MKKHPWLAIIAGVLVGSLTIVPLAFSQPRSPADQGQPVSFPSVSSGFVDAGVLLVTGTARTASITRVCTDNGNFYIECGSLFWNPGGTVQTVVSGSTLVHSAGIQATGAPLTSTAASGADGVSLTNESEIQWPDTKIAEVGTGITITAVALNTNAASFTGGTTTTNFAFQSNLADATATPTVCGVGIGPNTAYTAGDCVAQMSTSNGANSWVKVYQDQGAGVSVGTSNSGANIQGTLNINTTSVATVGTCVTPDILQTYTLPANSLTTTNRCIKVVAYGTQANNTNPKSIQLTMGPTPTVLITKQLQQTAVGAGDTWKIEAIICRTGASTQDYVAEATNYGGTTVAVVDGPTVLSEDVIGTLAQTETNALAISLQGSVCTTNGDITSELLMVEAL